MNTRISEARKARGWTQAQLAEEIGLSRNYVWMMENGDRTPTNRTISDICRVLNVRETWLRTGEGEMFLPVDADEELTEIMAEIRMSDDELIRAIIKGYWRLDEKGKAAVRSLVKELAAAVDKEKAPGD